MTLAELRASRSLVERLRALAGRNCEGSSLVELGVTLPIIFMLMTGIFAFSIALYQKLALAQGVGAGAMTIARDRGHTQSNGTTLDPCLDAATAIMNAAPSLNTTSMSVTIVINGSTLVNNLAVKSASCSGTTLSENNSASVSATYPCTINMYGLKFSSCSLSSSMTEEIQ